MFAYEQFGYNGTYIDIGAGEPQRGNNCYMLEVQKNWRGFSVEYGDSDQKKRDALKDRWKKYPERKNKIYWDDAISFDYNKGLLENKLNNDIDFLSCDIDPQENTLIALKKVLNDGVRPKYIAFETDYYREKIDYSNFKKMEEDSLKDFFCEKCVLQFDTKNIFDIHMETHKVQEREMGPKAKTCVICLAELSGTSSLKTHISIFHPEPHLRCSFCEIGFPNEAKLANHVATYHSKTKKIYVCSVCKAEFPRGELKVEHYSKVFYFPLLCIKKMIFQYVRLA